MLNCTQASTMLESYLDRELAPEQKIQVEEHLAGCGNCRAELESLKRLEEALRCAQPPARDDDFWAAYPEKLRRKIAISKSATSRRRILTVSTAIVSAAAAVLVAFLIRPLIQPPAITHAPNLVPPISDTAPRPRFTTPPSVKIAGLIETYATLQDDSNRKDIESELLENYGVKAVAGINLALENAMKNKNKDFAFCNRLAAMLGKLQSPSSAGVLIAALEYDELRQTAVESLGRIGSPRALPALVKWHSDEAVRQAIELHLRLAGKAGEAAILEALSYGNTAARNNAIALAGALKIKSAIPHLARLVKEKVFKSAVALALGNIGSPEAVPALFELAKDPATMDAAVEAVKKIGPDAVPSLVKYYQSLDSNNKVRAFKLLVLLEDASTVPYLISALAEKKLQPAALDTLKKITNQNFGPSPQQWWQWWQKEERSLRSPKSGSNAVDETTA